MTSIIYRNKIYIANAGDSRIIVGRQNKDLLWEPYQLSKDHKPDLQEENDRIVQCKGRVFPFQTTEGKQLGPHRVWHPTLDLPGLAMSRSIGDCLAHQFGVTSEPEVTEYEMTPQDKFIILASDGVWEFLSNQEVVDIVSIGIEDDNLKKAADDLVSQAHTQWLLNDN